MDDADIVKLYWQRDERAIPETAVKYGNYCASIARNMLGSEEDAEECVNDTYLSAWNSMPPNRPQVLSVFLGKLTRNLSLNRLKYNTALKRSSGEEPLVLDEIAELVSGEESAEQKLAHQELLAAINSFLRSLPESKRRIFVCRYWYFDSIAAIASRFGMSANHVSVTLSRLRCKLRKYLAERGFEP